jgi:hypothetical protein
METDGTYIWIVDNQDEEVYKYYMNGTYTGEHWDVAGSGVADSFGITENGTHFWVTSDDDTDIYVFLNTVHSHGNLTSKPIIPSSLAGWDRFYANDSILAASGTNITYQILNAIDNSTKCTITESEAGSGYSITSCAFGLASIRLFANLTTTNVSNTPALHDWNVSWNPDKPGVKLNSPADNSIQETSITFNCSATDNIQLENITLYNNLSGSWVENGTNPVGGTSNTTTFNRTVTSSGIYGWNCYACDNSSNCNFAAANRTFTVDTAPPNWSNNATNASNSTRTGESVQFNITWQDDVDLDTYVFSWNDTGNWVNITSGPMSGTWENVSMNETITATMDETVCWMFYANDSAGNWNETDVWCFTVNNSVTPARTRPP